MWSLVQVPVGDVMSDGSCDLTRIVRREKSEACEKWRDFEKLVWFENPVVVLQNLLSAFMLKSILMSVPVPGTVGFHDVNRYPYGSAHTYSTVSSASYLLQ